MPAPKLLSGLPKPVLFGLYGAVGGLLGALVFGELIMLVLGPKTATAAPPPPPPEPRLAVSAPTALQIYQGGTNKVLVQIARDAFEGDVTVRVDGLHEGVTAREAVIPANRTDGEIELKAAFSAAAGVEQQQLKVTATAKPDGKTVTAESAPFTLTPLASPRPQADIVFVLDVTGSMQNQIDGLKNGIGTFARDLEGAKVDGRFGCVAFRDLTMPEGDPVTFPSLQVLKFKGDPFTSDANTFRNEVGRQRASGGGDDPESSLEAITEATKLDFRKGAVRTLILITDAAPKIAVGQGTSIKATADALTDHKIDLLHLVINFPGQREYREVQLGALGVPGEKGGGRGREFSLDRTARDATTFTTVLLPEMTKAVVAAAEAKPANRPDLPKQEVARPELKTVKAVQSNQTYDASSTGQLVLAVGVWTGAIAALVCLFLLAGQHHYLRGTLPSVGGVAAGLAGGLIVGLVGGAAGQGLFLLADTDSKILAAVIRVMAWTLLGACAGAGLSLFVPNLKLGYGLGGGAAGGAAGALGYIAVEAVAGAVLGRLAGGLALGLCIGLMVAVVEAAFRRAWLEVRYGPREVVTVNLGTEPVKIGGDARACTVWARGAADVALRYFIRNGQVICTDVPSRDESEVRDGDTRAAGNVTVVVRTGSGTVPAAPAARQAPRPVAKPVAAPKPLDLDEDDGLPLPMPTPPKPAVPPAAPPKPVVATAPPVVPPRPVPASAPVPARPPVPPAPVARPVVPPAPKPAAPPPAAPAIKPTTRDPDACPVCGRKNPGRPGSRYCMVCDQTY